MIVALAVGIYSFVYGVLSYFDWQWLNEHFGAGGSSRWTQDVISGFLLRTVLFFAVGGLGVVTFVLGFLKVRKALDDDNQDEIKRWSFLTGLIGAVPGVGLGGLLELFVWRAHSTESFTIFGLLGKAPEPPPEPPSAMVIAQQQAAEDEARRKEEYMALFGGSSPAQPAQPSYGAGYGYQAAGYEDPYAQPQPAYEQPQPAYEQPQPVYDQQQPGYDQQQPAYDQQQSTYEQPPQQEAAAQPEGAQATQYHEQPGGAPICTCGRPMEWIAEYGRYYCYTDDRYEGEA